MSLPLGSREEGSLHNKMSVSFNMKGTGGGTGLESLCCLPCAPVFHHHFLNLLFCLHVKCKNYKTLVETDVLLQT